MVQLHRSRQKFEDIGFQVVLVGLGTPVLAEKFRQEFSLTFLIICDPDKELYREYGLGRGTIGNMASTTVLLRGLRAMSRGYTPGIPRGDVMQLPGVFLIDREGRIRYSYYSKDASDHPKVEDLLTLENII